MRHVHAELEANSVMYDPGDGGPPIPMPPRCAQHPGGVAGWLDELYARHAAEAAAKLLSQIRRAQQLLKITSLVSTPGPAVVKLSPAYTGLEVVAYTRLPEWAAAIVLSAYGWRWHGRVPICDLPTLIAHLQAGHDPALLIGEADGTEELDTAPED